MPEFHAAEAEQAAWKQKVLAREIVLEDLDVQKYDIYSHQNEHIVRLTPEQLKQKMAEKEAAAKRRVTGLIIAGGAPLQWRVFSSLDRERRARS